MPIITQASTQPSFKERIAQARIAMEYIPKRGWNDFHKYHYAEAGDVQGLCGKMLAEYGIILRKQNEVVEYDMVKTAKGGDETRCRVSVEYGLQDVYSDEVFWYPIHGEGRDSGDKSFYKALTGARKNCLIDALCLGIGEDPEASGDEERESKSITKPRNAGKVAVVPDKNLSPTISTEQAEEMSVLFRTHAELTHSTDLLERALIKWQIADLLHLTNKEYEPRMKWLKATVDATRLKLYTLEGTAQENNREPGED